MTSDKKKRIIGCLIGNIITALGISIFRIAGLGNDSYSGMMMAMGDILPISYALFQVLLNSLFFVAELIWGRKYINIGTFINWFLLGYMVTFFLWIYSKLNLQPTGFVVQLLIMAVGIIVLSFGLSIYQTADLGLAPYDSLSVIMTNKLPIPYFWNRMITDAICALVCWIAGGIVGVGMLVCAFCLGPFIHFFDKRFTRKLFG